MTTKRTTPTPLSMPERLALVGAHIEVREAENWVDAADVGRHTTVVPREALFDRGTASDEQIAALAEQQPMVEARISLGGTKVPAIAVTGIGRKQVWMAVRDLNLGAAWQLTARGVRVVTSDRSGLPEAEPDGAIAGGGTLAEALALSGLDGSVAPTWSSARKRGWVQGGDLGAMCVTCSSPLVWFDWLHAAAVRGRNTFFVLCATHGPVRWPSGDVLLDTRRDLDTGLRCAQADDRRNVYVFDVTGPSLDNAVYVGESVHEPHVRQQQHANGYKRARSLDKAGGVVGALRHDLMPELPPLHGAVSRYAERWWAEVLRRRGFDVLGGH